MIELDLICTELRDLLGPDIGIGVTNPKAPEGVLFPEEASAMGRAVPKRRLEFTAGRIAARQAMAEIGHPQTAVPMAPDRSPIWPDGLTGSIAHCDDVCIAVVAQNHLIRSIGIDVERDIPMDPDLEDVICTPSERTWLSTQSLERRGYLSKLIFCAKESAYKALSPLTGEMIGFEDVEIELQLDARTFQAFPRDREKFHGVLIRSHGWLMTAASQVNQTITTDSGI